VRAAIAMARALDLRVVAEGVETPDQKEFLTDAGVDLMQGFLFARPMEFSRLCSELTAAGPDSRGDAVPAATGQGGGTR